MQAGDDITPTTLYQTPESLREVPFHPLENIIGDPHEGIRTLSSVNQMIAHCAFVSQIEPKNFNEANNDSNWIVAMKRSYLNLNVTMFGSLYRNQKIG